MAKSRNRELASVQAPATPESVALLRAEARAAAAKAGASPERQRDVALAVSEAATNAVLHAYPDDGGPGTIELEVRQADDATLVVSVSDDGAGMKPRPDSPGMGLGLPVIAQLCEEVDIASAPGTTVRMRFALG